MTNVGKAFLEFSKMVRLTLGKSGLNAIWVKSTASNLYASKKPSKIFNPLEPKLLNKLFNKLSKGGFVTLQNRETHFDQSEPLILRRRRMQTKISAKSKIQNF